MLLWTWLRGLGDARFVTSLGRETARRCEAVVWERAVLRLGQMSLAEACGYVRAKARIVVENHLELATFAHPKLVASHRREIVELSLDVIVVRVIELHRARQQAAARRFTATRRAA